MVDPTYVPEANDIIKIDFGRGVGHEQRGWRPALVLSPQLYNRKTSLAVVVPITNQAKGYTFEVPLPSQMRARGVLLADAIKSVDWRARNAKYVDTASPELVGAVHERLALLLGFPSP